MGTSVTDIVPDSPDEMNEKKTDADLAVLSHDEGAASPPELMDTERRKSVALNIIENPLTVSELLINSLVLALHCPYRPPFSPSAEHWR